MLTPETTLAAALLIGTATGVLVAMRTSYANRVTTDQCLALLTAVYRHRDWTDLQTHLYVVDFDEHFNAVFWGRDPRALYHPDIQAIWPAE